MINRDLGCEQGFPGEKRGGGQRDPPISTLPHSIKTLSPIKRTCQANRAGENSPFIFKICVKSVPLYNFKLAHVVLHMPLKEFFETHF